MSGKIDIQSEINSLTASVGTPHVVIQRLIKISIEAKEDDKVFVDSVESFFKANNLDIVASCLSALDNGVDVFSISYFLKTFFPRLKNIDIQVTHRLLLEFANRMKNDLAGGIFYEAVRNWSELNTVQGHELVRLIENQNFDELNGYFVCILTGLVRGDFTNTYGILKKYIESNHELKHACAIRVLGNSVEECKPNYDDVRKLILEGNQSQSEVVATASAFATGMYIGVFEDFVGEFEKLSLSPFPNVQYEISRKISLLKSYSEKWYERSFLNLAKIKEEYLGIIRNLDGILYDLLKTSNHLKLVEDFFCQWTESHEYKKDTKSFFEVFESCAHHLLRHKPFIETLLTKWFNSDDYRYHRNARDLLDFAGSRRFSQFRFDPAIIGTFNEEDILYVIRKILGYVFNFDQSATLIFSLLKHPTLSKSSRDLVATVFVDHIGDNHPQRMVEYCERHLKLPDLNDNEKVVLQVVASKLKSISQTLNSLPMLLELRPKLDVVFAIEKERDKKISEAMEGAEKQSKLLSMVKKISLKHGRGWFSYMNGVFSDISNLQQFSESYELPKSDVLDVINASVHRHGFRKAKRGDK